MQKITFDPSSPVVVLDVSIKAKRTTIAKLVLDTGASCVVLRWKLIYAVGLTIDPRKTTQTTTATTVETVPEVIIPEMSVLGRSVKNVEAIVKDLPPESHVDGLLGLSFLRHFTVMIDFRSGVLSLE